MKKALALLVLVAAPAVVFAAPTLQIANGHGLSTDPSAFLGGSSSIDRSDPYYATSFEDPPFVPGPIAGAPGNPVGQGGWFALGQTGGGNAANRDTPVIASFLPSDGAQHLAISRGPGAATTSVGVLSPDLGDFTNQLAVIEADIFLSGTNSASPFIAPQAPSQGKVLTRVYLLNSGSLAGRVGVLDDPDGAGPAPLGIYVRTDLNSFWVENEYRTVRIVANPANNQIRVWYGGNFVYEQEYRFANAVENLALASQNNWADVSHFAFYDNIKFPEPSTLSLLGLGLLGFLRRR